MSKHLIKVGTILTIANEVITESGHIILGKGQKVTVIEVITKGGNVGKQSGIYYPEYIWAVRLKGKIGVWFNRTFVEPFL